MPRSGGRLTLKGALNRNMPPSHLNPLTTEPSSKHASVCRLERELKAVKEENNRLRDHLEETRSVLKEITSEASLEKFDERRINLLKMQNIQLQRQILLMSEALGSRSTAITEVENVLTWLLEKFRFYIGMDVRGAEVPVPRSELITMVDTSESARIKLFKNIENCSKENLSRSQMLMNPFLKPGQDTQFTVLDSCLGRLDCLSLKHVAQLESKLSRLYKELIQLSEYLNSRAETEQGRVTGGHMNQAVREREGTVVLRACALSRECAADLLSLSLLVPSAPWPPLKKSTMTEVTYEALAPSLPTLPRGKAAMVQQCVTAALKACNHRCHMVAQEAGALREEVRFHQAVYQLQLDYVHQVFDALRQGYSEFELSTNDLVIQPMKKLLEAYRTLKTNTSHEELREFLTVLKEQEPQWTNTIQKLDISDPQNQSGSVALSAFGEEFLASLDRLVLARQTQRDKATSQKEELKAAQHQLEEELRSLIRDREEQRNIAKEMKTENVKTNGDIFSDSKTELEISEVSHRSSSHKADESGEMITGLRPWLDDQDTNSSNAGGKKKGSKARSSSLTNRKPWQDVGEVSDTGLPPWSDRSHPGSRQEGGGETGREAVSGLRPWLDEPTSARDSQERYSASASGRRSRDETPESENSDMPFSSHRSSHDGDSRHGLGHQNGTDSERSERLLHLASDRQREPSDMGQNTSHPFPFQSDSQNVSVKPFPKKPPVAVDSTSKRQPAGSEREKNKRQGKPRNYEPKLYVANKTLSLRRSGSLSRLSEPSLHEQMSRMSVTSRQTLENSRTKGETGGK